MNALLFVASLTCVAAASIALARSLPAQNVAFIILVLAAVEFALVRWQGKGTALSASLFWPAVIIFSRIAGQIVLRPCRRARNYGIILIGGASTAAALVALALDSPQRAINRFCLTAVCLVFLTPWFLQKRVTASGESRR
jgi:hypothetical protein